MDEERKNAFRRIFHAAMLDLRAHSSTSAYAAYEGWKVWRWHRVVRRLQTIQVTADWLHNLAYCSATDFNGFDERMFWGEYYKIVKRWPGMEDRLRMYRNAFESDGPFGSGAKMRAWGSPGAGTDDRKSEQVGS